MTNIKTCLGLLVAVAAAVAAFGAAQASASSAPIVITYEKTCIGATCSGTTGDGGTIEMQVTGFRATGGGAQLTLKEEITGSTGRPSFTAEMSGTLSPDGFIVLNGTVTEGAFVGAQVHQRSNLDAGTVTAGHWNGQLQLMPATA